MDQKMSIQRDTLPNVEKSNSNNTSQDSFFVAIIRPRLPSDISSKEKDPWIKEIWLHGEGTSYFTVPVTRGTNIMIINKEDRKIRRQKHTSTTRNNRKHNNIRKGTQKAKTSKRQVVKKAPKDDNVKTEKIDDLFTLIEIEKECLVMKENENVCLKENEEKVPKSENLVSAILENVTEKENHALEKIENETDETGRLDVGVIHQNEHSTDTSLREKDLECGHPVLKNVDVISDKEKMCMRYPCSGKKILLVTASVALASLGYFVFFRK